MRKVRIADRVETEVVHQPEYSAKLRPLPSPARAALQPWPFLSSRGKEEARVPAGRGGDRTGRGSHEELRVEEPQGHHRGPGGVSARRGSAARAHGGEREWIRTRGGESGSAH